MFIEVQHKAVSVSTIFMLPVAEYVTFLRYIFLLIVLFFICLYLEVQHKAAFTFNMLFSLLLRSVINSVFTFSYKCICLSHLYVYHIQSMQASSL